MYNHVTPYFSNLFDPDTLFLEQWVLKSNALLKGDTISARFTSSVSETFKATDTFVSVGLTFLYRAEEINLGDFTESVVYPVSMFAGDYDLNPSFVVQLEFAKTLGLYEEVYPNQFSPIPPSFVLIGPNDPDVEIIPSSTSEVKYSNELKLNINLNI